MSRAVLAMAVHHCWPGVMLLRFVLRYQIGACANYHHFAQGDGVCLKPCISGESHCRHRCTSFQDYELNNLIPKIVARSCKIGNVCS
jgi:hypothetical protein